MQHITDDFFSPHNMKGYFITIATFLPSPLNVQKRKKATLFINMSEDAELNKK